MMHRMIVFELLFSLDEHAGMGNIMVILRNACAAKLHTLRSQLDSRFAGMKQNLGIIYDD